MGIMAQIEKVVYWLMNKMSALEEEIRADIGVHQAASDSPQRVELFDAMMEHGDGSIPLSFGAAPYMLSSLFYVIRGLQTVYKNPP